jgi:hypothetical protein
MRLRIRSFAKRLAVEVRSDQIGRTYLSLHADENDSERLLREVMGAVPVVPWWSSQQSVERALRSGIDRDYSENRVERLHGWVLSKTELRLYALSVTDAI